MRFSPYDMHEEALAAAGRAEDEEVAVVGVFLLAFLARYIDGHRHALAVGVVAPQRSDVAPRLALLVHQAQGGLAEGEETVVLGVKRKAVAGEAGDEQLQLVIGPAADTDVLLREDVLQMVGDLLHVLVGTGADNHVEMGVHQLAVLAGHDLLRLLDVLGGNHVGGVGHGTVLVLLLLKVVLLLLLVGDEEHLVVNQSVGIGNAVDVAHQVNGHGGIIDTHVRIGAQDIRQAHGVEVYQAEHLALPVAHADSFAVNLEVGHGKDPVAEVDGEETVGILTDLLHIEEGTADAAVRQQRIDLLYFHLEIIPFLRLKSKQTSLLAFLRDDEIGAAGRIGTALEETEIAFGEETLAVIAPLPEGGCRRLRGWSRLVGRTLEGPADKDVLLVKGIALAERGDNGRHQVDKAVIAVHVGRELQDGVLHLDDGGIFARLGVYDTEAVGILDAEIDVLEDTGTLATSAEGLDGDTHADENGDENQYTDQCNHNTPS